MTHYEEAFSLVRRAKPPVELHLLDGVTNFMLVDADPRVALTLRNWLDRYFRRADKVDSSLRAKRSNPAACAASWIASSLCSSQ